VRANILRRTEQYFLNPDLETRAAFDEFVVEMRRTQSALSECEDFVSRITRLKLQYIADDSERGRLRAALERVRLLCMSLDASLRGSDDPDVIVSDDD
jgi:hypothetical protein